MNMIFFLKIDFVFVITSNRKALTEKIFKIRIRVFKTTVKVQFHSSQSVIKYNSLMPVIILKCILY